jgi:hypothetical protein
MVDRYRGNLQEALMTHWHDTMVDTPETDGTVYVTGWTISGRAVLGTIVAARAFGIWTRQSNGLQNSAQVIRTTFRKRDSARFLEQIGDSGTGYGERSNKTTPVREKLKLPLSWACGRSKPIRDLDV